MGPVGPPDRLPGAKIGPRASQAARVIWQGKVFSDDGTTAVNRFFGRPSCAAMSTKERVGSTAVLR